jgi:NO-binding membrane sensor protein with MHYT domain
MADIHHFAYGWFNPVVAYLMAFLGAVLGLVCARRARHGRVRARRVRWLVTAAVSIGGVGAWLMHFMALIGFDVPASPVRYDPLLTGVSLVLVVATVAGGLLVAGLGRRRLATTLLGGGVIGMGLAGMHYAGMLAVRVAGTITYTPRLVALSVAIAVLAGAASLWLATSGRSLAATAAAAAILAAGAVGMHYAGMAAVRVRLYPDGAAVAGLSPLLLVVPITLVTASALIALAFNALQAMTEEEFDGAAAGRHHRRGGAHGEVPWQLHQLPAAEPTSVG